MDISVASGKGGTGKTTVSTSLAASLPGKIQFLDCDVEAPNAHLFIKPKVRETVPVNAPVPNVDLSRCTFCKKCMDICRFSALAVLKDNILVFENNCHSCGGCQEICPENAIDLRFREIGNIKTGTKDNIEFSNGCLEIGQVMAPPVIKQVRAQSKKDVITIIDAPPGTSCPVITAINNTDFTILVTEPTPFGLHDLKLAVKTVEELGIPHGIVINRSGSSNSIINDYANKKSIPVLMEIPFERQIARTCSNGKILSQEIPDLKAEFRQMFDKIETLIHKEKQQ